MSRKKQINTQRIFLACFSVVITLMAIVTTPALAKANDRSTNSSSTLSSEWRTVVGTSMATLKQVITGNTGADSPQENGLSNEEMQMITLINQERADAGLKELVVDDSLVKLAKEKSMDMVAHNYFGHTSDHLGTMYDQLKRNQVLYHAAAENLAGAADVQKAQQYFLNSPSHRWNILNPLFTKVGVGIVRGGPFGSMMTQLFLR